MKHDGGPAFPIADQYTPNGDAVCQGCTGMTLRDYFACAAMASGSTDPHKPKGFQGTWEEFIAEAAYRLADAMLVERAK